MPELFNDSSVRMMCGFVLLGYCRVYWGENNKVELRQKTLIDSVAAFVRSLLQRFRKVLQFKQA